MQNTYDNSERKTSAPNEQSWRRPLNMQRRRALHQIICRKEISARTRVIARTIAQLEYGYRSDRGVGSSTCASDMTIARKAGRRLHEVTTAVRELEEAGQLGVRRRGNGTRDMRLKYNDRVDSYLPSINGDRAFFKSGAWRDQIKKREGFIDTIFADPTLTDGEKLIAYSLISLTNPHSLRCEETMETIAGIVGKGKATAIRAISQLARRGLIAKDGYGIAVFALRTDADPVHGRSNVGPTSVQDESRSAESMGISAPRYGDSGYSGDIPTKSRPPQGGGAADRQLNRLEPIDLWIRLYGLITNYGKVEHNGELWHTFGGIIKSTRDSDWLAGEFDASQIQQCVRAGLLEREGDRVVITDRGHAAYHNATEQMAA